MLLDDSTSTHESDIAYYSSEEFEQEFFESFIPDQCPRFEKCNAPICPLDINAGKVKHLDGEGVCFFIREYAKGSKKLFGRSIENIILSIVKNRFDYLMDNCGKYFRKSVRQSSTRLSKRTLFDKVRRK